MTPTYDLIASAVLTSTTATVTFSSISGYRDLVLVCNPRGASAFLQFNSDTGNNYSEVNMFGNGTSANGGQSATIDRVYVSEADGMGIANIMDYSTTDKHKTVIARQDIASSFTQLSSHRWANTSAITSILIYNRFSNNFTAGSTFYLYGIVS